MPGIPMNGPIEAWAIQVVPFPTGVELIADFDDIVYHHREQ